VKFARFSVAASIAVAVITAVMLLTVKPPTQCPDWRLPDGGRTSMWVLLAGWTTPFLAGGCFVAICWNWVIRRMIKDKRGISVINLIGMDF
jgi:hypothetical protein